MLKTLQKMDEYSSLPLRLGLGALFMFLGIVKATDLAVAAATFASWGFPAAKFFAGFVMIIEIISALFLIFGLLTRYTAVALSIGMLIAILAVNIRISGMGGVELMKAIALFGAALTLAFAGAKRPSLDEHYLLD